VTGDVTSSSINKINVFHFHWIRSVRHFGYVIAGVLVKCNLIAMTNSKFMVDSLNGHNYNFIISFDVISFISK
jgi:hypothetical protein